jgi:hypothetical protein
MNDIEWSTYVDSGEVPFHFFKDMVKLIKNGDKLNQQHLAVYTSHCKIIEVMLLKK